jgi:hypothetical protein
LFKTSAGRFFRQTSTDVFESKNIIEPLTIEEAVTLWNTFATSNKTKFNTAFPELKNRVHDA